VSHRQFLHIPLLFCAALALAGCESSEERAERHFQAALVLLEEGDVDRALVELRNVMKFDDTHSEGRLTYANVLAEQGNMEQAISQYLRVAEQHPDLLEARVETARLALQQNAWEQAERHGRAAKDLAPDDAEVIFLNAILDYRAARQTGDELQMDEALTIVRQKIASDPANRLARRLTVEHAIRQGDINRALHEVNDTLAHLPDDLDMHLTRLQLQMKRQDMPAIGATLQEMVARFPEDQRARNMLLAWYLEQGEIQQAEAFLRQQANAPGAGTDKHIQVVDFLRSTQGNDAARAELNRLINADGDEKIYKATLAALDFEEGNTEAAIADMHALLSGAAASEETANLQVALARMQVSTGNVGGAKALINAVLDQTPGHVEALKMRAIWQIEDDQPEDAILTLRTAQAEAPRDPVIMSLMGQAHERAGARELAGERYALAVEASGRAPDESLNYAAFLLRDDRIEVAEQVLNDALRRSPSDPRLLSAMADLQMRQQNWTRATRIIWQLRGLENPAASAAADRIEVTYLTHQNRIDDVAGLLASLSEADHQDTATLAELIRVLVQQDRTDEAQDLLTQRLADSPDDPALRFLQAGLHLATGATDQAETIYRALLKDAPDNTRPLRQLVLLLQSEGRGAEVDAVIDAAIAAQPQAVFPRLLRAEQLERAGDFAGAIALYDELYAEDSGNLVLANNLASLIATHHQDEESLSRAYAIARRLRNTDIPALQDTYGWIAFRRGNHFEALNHLEPAALGLPDDPMVQYHLAETYMALGRVEDATRTLNTVLLLASDGDFPQLDRAHEMLRNLQVAD